MFKATEFSISLSTTLWAKKKKLTCRETKLFQVQHKVSTISDESGSCVICWCRSKAHQVQRPLYGDADSIFQQVLVPAHTCINDHGIAASDWPAVNPVEILWSIVQRKMSGTRASVTAARVAFKATHYSWTPQQNHRLIALMPDWRSNSCTNSFHPALIAHTVQYMDILFHRVGIHYFVNLM